MRRATDGRSPRYAIGENVPGAFSSHHGRDFAAVLTSVLRVTQPQAPDLRVPDQGWPKAGLVLARGCSISWRVLDAQHFGVPQRRRRIFLVADFAGQRAGDILFEPPRLPRHSEPRGTQEQDHAAHLARCAHSHSRTKPADPNLSAVVVNHHPHDGRIGIDSGGVVQTLTSRMGSGGGNVPLILDRPVFAVNSVHTDRKPGGMFGKPAAVAKTLDLRGGDPGCNQGGMIILDQADIYSASKTDYFLTTSTNQAGALVASDYKASPIVGAAHLRPRKLTPTECARLQGFPDDWCDDLAIPAPSDE